MTGDRKWLRPNASNLIKLLSVLVTHLHMRSDTGDTGNNYYYVCPLQFFHTFVAESDKYDNQI